VIYLGTAALGCLIERSSIPFTYDSEANFGFALRSKFRFWLAQRFSAAIEGSEVKAALAGGERSAVNSSALHLDEFSFAASVVPEGSSLTAFFGTGFFAASARFRS
jgi:hypothetical protein